MHELQHTTNELLGDKQADVPPAEGEVFSTGGLAIEDIGKEFQGMMTQYEQAKALKEEQLATAVERADLAKERADVVKLLSQAENKQCSEQAREQSVRHHVPRSSNKCPKFNGETEWGAFMVQFQAWMRLNQYDKDDCQMFRSDLLGLALEGEAQMFYSGLSEEERRDYSAMVAKLEKRYGGDNTAEVYKAKLLSGRKRSPDEPVSKLRDELWLMARKGYPHLSSAAKEQMALDALLRAVEQDLRLQCTMKECSTLDDAVAIMERYEAVSQGDLDRKKKVVRMVSNPEVAVDKESPLLTALNEQTKSLQTLCVQMHDQLQQQTKVLAGINQNTGQGFSRKGRRSNVGRDECFNCGGKGHFARDCPQRNGTNNKGMSVNTNPPAAQ